MIHFFSSLPKESAERWQTISEVVLVVSGLALAFDAIGEYLGDHEKLPRLLKWPKLVFILIVVASLIGEFAGDAGVFLTSRRLQEVEDV